MFSTRFCFGVPSQVKDVALPNSILMRIQQDSVATATIRFIQNGRPVVVPNGLLIKDETENEMVSTVERGYNDNMEFVLGWTCSYSITLNGKEIVSLVNSRDWDPDLYMTPPEKRFWTIFSPR